MFPFHKIVRIQSCRYTPVEYCTNNEKQGNIHHGGRHLDDTCRVNYLLPGYSKTKYRDHNYVSRPFASRVITHHEWGTLKFSGYLGEADYFGFRSLNFVFFFFFFFFCLFFVVVFFFFFFFCFFFFFFFLGGCIYIFFFY